MSRTIKIDGLDSTTSLFPIGYVLISLYSTNPGDYFGGTWQIIPGRFLYGTGQPGKNSYTGFGQLGDDEATWDLGPRITAGEFKHDLTVNEMPSHQGHLYDNFGGYFERSGDTNSYYFNVNSAPANYFNKYANRPYQVVQGNEIGLSGVTRGNDEKHNNMPPFIVVYMWKRTA